MKHLPVSGRRGNNRARRKARSIDCGRPEDLSDSTRCTEQCSMHAKLMLNAVPLRLTAVSRLTARAGDSKNRTTISVDRGIHSLLTIPNTAKRPHGQLSTSRCILAPKRNGRTRRSGGNLLGLGLEDGEPSDDRPVGSRRVDLLVKIVRSRDCNHDGMRIRDSLNYSTVTCAGRS